jgi:hypothetical protein
MTDARKQILDAIKYAKITAAGKQSLLAVAARALDPEVKISKQGLSEALGFHPSLLIAVLVTADAAGDPLSRRDLGQRLFSEVPLHTYPPELTAAGRLAVAIWCLEQLEPVEALLAGALPRALELARTAAEGGTPAEGALSELHERVQQVQRAKIVPVPKGERTKMGLSQDDRVRRHGGQCIAGLIQGLRDSCSDDAFCVTAAGEAAGALCESEAGLDAGVDLCVGLAALLDDLPDGHVSRRPSNGG